MEVTSDERIEMEIRLQLLAKVRAAVAKAQSKNTPPTNPNYTSFIHPQGRAEQ
jgi:thiaminase